ncbi:serine hydrolase [Spirochaetia bacterium]|nr:serine hydrolase [Spirochaetia bacterium]GHU57926.1 serine hydrolase [Spirochaetia bacterium]
MSRYDHLSRPLKQFSENGPAGCACALARDGKILYEGYYGYADKEAGIPINESTVYRLYSMTKVLVCTAALLQFERGKFLLNEPLYEYFPEYRKPLVVKDTSFGWAYGGPALEEAEAPMLIKHAFTMAVGLPYPNGETPSAIAMKQVRQKLEAQYGKFDLQTDIKAMAAVPLAFEPGTHFLYGYGHDLVAGLVEVTSGKTIGQFLKDEIFDPLGMGDTGYRYFGDIKSRMAALYRRDEDGTLTKIDGFMDKNHEPDAVYESGGAGLFSTVKDYLKFTQMMARGGVYEGQRIIGRKTIDLMRRNHLNEEQLRDFACSYQAGYGYGLGVRTMMDPAAGGSNGSIGEFGWTGFAGTWTFIDPAEGFSGVYMHQMLPNREEYHHHRVRAAAYGCLE